MEKVKEAKIILATIRFDQASFWNWTHNIASDPDPKHAQTNTDAFKICASPSSLPASFVEWFSHDTELELVQGGAFPYFSSSRTHQRGLKSWAIGCVREKSIQRERQRPMRKTRLRGMETNERERPLRKRGRPTRDQSTERGGGRRESWKPSEIEGGVRESDERGRY